MHVVTVAPEPRICLGGRLDLLAVPAGVDNLVWVARCRATGAVALIDGPGADEALAACASRGWTPSVVWITHTHGDHTGIAAALAGRLPVVGCAATASRIPGLTHPVDAGDTVTLGALTARVLRTDGHLTGHLSFWFPGTDGVVFCGDTLFGGGCGYPFDGPLETLLASLLSLAALPPDTAVCCAHEYTLDGLRFAWTVEPGNPALARRWAAAHALRAQGGCTLPSTIGLERATNPFLRTGALARPGETPDQTFSRLRLAKNTRSYLQEPPPPIPTPPGDAPA